MFLRNTDWKAQSHLQWVYVSGFNRFMLAPHSGILWHISPPNIILLPLLLLLLPYHIPYFPFTSFFPGHPERETTITFHQRLSQYYSSISSKWDKGYWSLHKRRVEIVEGVCVCSPAVSRDNRQRQSEREKGGECSVWPSQTVCEVWQPEATSHSFISIKLTFYLKHLPALKSITSLSPSYLSSTPCIFLILRHTTRGPCVHNKQMHILYSQPHATTSPWQ